VFLKGNESGLESWVSGLEPKEGEVVISKRYPSAFFATDLSTRLQLRGIDTLVICGVSTSGCVRASTLDAMCLGFRPIVCVATHESRDYTNRCVGCWRSLRGPVACCP
jgi:nicotinamidase-related amidase